MNELQVPGTWHQETYLFVEMRKNQATSLLVDTYLTAMAGLPAIAAQFRLLTAFRVSGQLATFMMSQSRFKSLQVACRLRMATVFFEQDTRPRQIETRLSAPARRCPAACRKPAAVCIGHKPA